MRVVVFTMEVNNIDFEKDGSSEEHAMVTAATRKNLEHCAQVTQVSDANTMTPPVCSNLLRTLTKLLDTGCVYVLSVCCTTCG